MPARGFFQLSTLRGETGYVSSVAKCGACGLLKNCNSPKLEVAGKGKRKILLVSESPGATEDETGKQFAGSAGKMIKKILAKFGVDMYQDCWLTSALICYPNKVEVKPEHIDFCRPNIINTINELKPEVIVLMGKNAIRSVIGWLWKKDNQAALRFAGFEIPLQKINAWVIPTFNALDVQRQIEQSERRREKAPASIFFERHLKAACDKGGRPYVPGEIPNRQAKVEVILDLDKAAREIRRITKRGGLTAMDYEANMRKPDSKAFRVLSCSICDSGERTIAYPWEGPTIEATREYILSGCRKIASNLKYEDRVTRRVFGHGVRNWAWDTMLSAHSIDSRRGICSVKFQSFVLLGEDSYNDCIEEFLQSGGSNTPNRAAEEIELSQLLHYNGMDSQVEYDVAEIQARILGAELV